MILTKEILPRGWKLSFEINPFGTVNDQSNILHGSVGDDGEGDDVRIPAGFFQPGKTKLRVCSSINGIPNHCFEDDKDLPLHKQSVIVVEQRQSKENHQYYIKIFVNGEQIENFLNEQPKVYTNVKYFASSPWEAPAKAAFHDFELKTYEHIGMKIVGKYFIKKKVSKLECPTKCIQYFFIFFFIGRENLQRSNLITTKELLHRGWKLSFVLNPYMVRSNLSNILHATVGNDNGKYGERTPAVFFLPGSSKLRVCSAINGNANYCFDSDEELPLHQHSKITVEQRQSLDDYDYYFQVLVNDKVVLPEMKNEQPEIFNGVKYYASSP